MYKTRKLNDYSINLVEKNEGLILKFSWHKHAVLKRYFQFSFSTMEIPITLNINKLSS